MSDLPKSKKKRNQTPYKSVGISKHPLYPVWRRMIYRCYAKSGPRYAEWGGRGIRVDDLFLENFYAFVDEIGPRPTPAHSIDRIDNAGNYAPGNIRWSLPREQTLNSSQVVMLTYNGKTQCLKDWADELGFSYKCITKRWQSGKTVEEILLPPSKKPDKTPEPRGWVDNGKWLSIEEVSKKYSLPKKTLVRRYEHGWDLERSITQNIRQTVFVELNGETLPFKVACAKLKLSPTTIVHRMKQQGMTFEEAINKGKDKKDR